MGLFGAIAFVWFSTRLFGSLRTVLAEIFDIEQERGIVQGKIFDIKITVLASLLFAANTVLSAYLTLATTRGVSALSRFGIAPDVMGSLEFYVGWSLAFAVLVLMFFALYKFLPVRRIRWQAALLAAAFTSIMFEAAKYGFTAFLESFNPGSLYTGTLYVIVIGVAVLAGIGAGFGAANTMYAAVQSRTAEIGTLRALGLARRAGGGDG